MNDERMRPLLKAWFQARSVGPADVPDGVAQVVARLPQSPQRGRWWPLPRLDRPTAIPPTNGRMPARGFTMFSALKFVAASVIVALFGGFLLQGMFTMQSEEARQAAVSGSPATETTSEPTEGPKTSVRSDILPDVELTVEEVEPGVFQVLSDGVRDLVFGGNTEVVAGHDDGIWLLRKNRFFRVGSEAGHAWPKEGGRYHGDFEVTPEGTVWVIRSGYRNHFARLGDLAERGMLFSSDGDGWTRTRLPHEVLDIAVAPDGTLWGSWWAAPRLVRYLGPSGWQPINNEADSYWDAQRLHPIDSGILYAVGCWFGCSLNRYEDGAWTTIQNGQGSDVAPDGTVWFLGHLDLPPPVDIDLARRGGDTLGALMEWRADADRAADSALARFAGGAWEWWEPDDLPDMGLGIALEGESVENDFLLATFRAAPDGSLWASLWQRGPAGDEPPAGGLWTGEQRHDKGRYDPQCDGLVRFDGENTDNFLRGHCITMDIAADGSVWVLADDEKGKHLYVITPEAVVASE